MKTKVLPLRLALCLFLLLSSVLVSPPPAVRASASGIVISQIYGGGGNAGSTFKNDFIEIFNADGATVSLNGWSVQYASAAGTTWQVTALSGSLAPGQYFLIQESPHAERHGQYCHERYGGQSGAGQQYGGFDRRLPGGRSDCRFRRLWHRR